MLGQIGIVFGVVLAGMVGIAIAAPPEHAPEVAGTSDDTVIALDATTAVTDALAQTTPPASTVPITTPVVTVASTTIPETTVPLTTVPQTSPPTAVPVVEPVVLMTAELVDGDTITMSDGSTVRLIGIDTPERGECGFEEASMVLAQLITGQSITLVPGARDDVDRYGRLLRYVEVNGVDADLMMIESGRAIARYDGRDGYGTHPRQDAYVQADAATPSLNVCAPLAVAPAADLPPVADVYYANCSEVRAAGAAPIYPGDPGWRSKFDGDDDGVGCE